MLALYKNGKFYDYGTRNHVSFYVKLGYTVKVMNEREADDFVYKRKVKHVWDKLPKALKKRVAQDIRREVPWQVRYGLMMERLDIIARSAARIHVVPQPTKEWTITEQLVGVYNDIKKVIGFFKDLMTPMTAAQLQLVNS